MWPFELRGPEFLLFYILYGIIVLAIAYWARASLEPVEGVRLTDPYQIAFLRGGATESIRVVIAGLVDRELLKVDGQQLVSAKISGTGWHPLERAILEHFSTPTAARSALVDHILAMTAKGAEPALVEMGLLPTQELRGKRAQIVAAAIIALWFVAGTKIAIGISRDRPVGFLIALAIAFSIVVALAINRRRTRAGDAALEDMRTLLSGLRYRTAAPSASFAEGELALAMAVFGMTALPSEHYRHIRALFPVPTAGSSSGSSCGSSCSSGSSCGGGCGGGCGGCGG